MLAIALGVLSVILFILSLFLCLVILLQRPRQDAGMGAALGGGLAESAFGAESGNVLTRTTVWGSVVFFVLCLVLYLGYLSLGREELERRRALPEFAVPAVTGDPAAAGTELPVVPGVAVPEGGEVAPGAVEVPAPGAAPATGGDAAPAPAAVPAEASGATPAPADPAPATGTP